MVPCHGLFQHWSLAHSSQFHAWDLYAFYTNPIRPLLALADLTPWCRRSIVWGRTLLLTVEREKEQHSTNSVVHSPANQTARPVTELLTAALQVGRLHPTFCSRPSNDDPTLALGLLCTQNQTTTDPNRPTAPSFLSPPCRRLAPNWNPTLPSTTSKHLPLIQGASTALLPLSLFTTKRDSSATPDTEHPPRCDLRVVSSFFSASSGPGSFFCLGPSPRHPSTYRTASKQLICCCLDGCALSSLASKRRPARHVSIASPQPRGLPQDLL